MPNHKDMTRRRFLLLASITAGTALVSSACEAIVGKSGSEIRFINTSYGEKNPMNDKVLVTYASRAGSTAGVADAIGKTLVKNGASVEVKPMREVNDLGQYHAVVAGSAIRGQKWLPEAMEFLSVHQAEISHKPFVSFMVCITLAMKNGDQYREGLKSWMAPIRSAGRSFSEGYFAGALDLDKLSGMDKIKMGTAASLGIFPKGDFRDWKAIEAWADSINSKL
jgi:menaquinone-dependent protoporphyrinogen oxidase